MENQTTTTIENPTEPTLEVSNPSNVTQHWYESENIDQAQLSEKVKGFSDVNALIKSYNEAQTYIGGSVKIPSENASDDDMSAFYTKLGRPNSADDYQWNPPDGTSIEGVTNQHFAEFKKQAHQLGLTNKQLTGVMSKWSSIVSDLQNQTITFKAQQADTAKAQLSAANNWGDKYDDRVASVMQTIDKLGIRESLDLAGVLYDVNVLKAFDSIISAKQESRIKGNDGKFVSSDERISQLKSNPAYYQAGHPEHSSVVSEINRILATKNQ